MRAQRITNLQEKNSPRLTSWRAKRKLAGSYQKQDSGSALIILSPSNGGYFSYFLFKLSWNSCEIYFQLFLQPLCAEELERTSGKRHDGTFAWQTKVLKASSENIRDVSNTFKLHNIDSKQKNLPSIYV